MKNYCHLCGAKYELGKNQPWECQGCGNLSYMNAVPAAEVLLFNAKGDVLIAQRGIEPNKGKYDFPGGFVDLGETFEEAMKREAIEELRLIRPIIAYLYMSLVKPILTNSVRKTATSW